MRFLAVALACLCVWACARPEGIVLIGASTPAIPDSIVVVSGGKIRAAGARKDVPVPQDSRRVDLSGSFLVPAPGNRVAPGEPASFEIRTGGSGGPVVRRIKAGKWIP